MVYRNFSNRGKKLYAKFKLWFDLKTSKTFWLSLGENCLTDYILSEYELKSFSTIYSNGRSNIDYALFLEKADYKNLLLPRNLKCDFRNNAQVVRSTLVIDCDPIFQELQMNGFEFTHHNVLENKSDLESYKRKIQRQLTFRRKKNFIFLYHHRINENTDFALIFNKLYEFSLFYTTQKHFCKIIVFSQNVVKTSRDRKITYEKINSSVHFFNLSTLKIWEGDGDDFWAKNDFDLIEQLIARSQMIAKEIVK